MLLHRTWGDEEEPTTLVLGPAGAEALAARVAHWVTGHQAGPLAALALEQLDPAGTLNARDRAGWDRALAEITEFGWCGFGAGDEVLDRLRALLADQDEDYRRAASGLADPRSRDGLALLATLEDAVEHAATGDLQGGNWTDPGVLVERADTDQADGVGSRS